MDWEYEEVGKVGDFELVVRWRKIVHFVHEEVKLVAEAELVLQTNYSEDVLAERYYEEKIEFLSEYFDTALEKLEKRLQNFVKDLKDWAMVAEARMLRLKARGFSIQL